MKVAYGIGRADHRRLTMNACPLVSAVSNCWRMGVVLWALVIGYGSGS